MVSEAFELELELDVTPASRDTMCEGNVITDTSEVRLEVTQVEGHGFGVTEVVDLLVNFGVSLSAAAVYEAIRAGVHGSIRAARVKNAENSSRAIADEVANKLSDPEA